MIVEANLIPNVVVPPLPLDAFRRHISALPPLLDIDFVVALVHLGVVPFSNTFISYLR